MGGIEETGYRWLRFYVAMQDIAGGIAIALGIVILVVSIAGAREDRTALIGLPMAAGLVLAGIVIVAIAQGLKAVADIADNSRSLPAILRRLDEFRPQSNGHLTGQGVPGEPIEVPELGGRPFLCPACDVPVTPSNPICPRCGKRVRISRPA